MSARDAYAKNMPTGRVSVNWGIVPSLSINQGRKNSCVGRRIILVCLFLTQVLPRNIF